jgi:hypothetical protein
MSVKPVLATFLLLSLVLAPAATAQVPEVSREILSFDLTADQAIALVAKNPNPAPPYTNEAVFEFTVTDTSPDNTDPQSAGGGSQARHTFVATIQWEGGTAPRGWAYQQPQPNFFSLSSGQTQTFQVALKPLPTASEMFAKATVNVTMRDQVGANIRAAQEMPIVAKLVSEPGVFVRVGAPPGHPDPPTPPSQVGPGDVVKVPFTIFNTDLYPTQIRVTATFEEGVDGSALGVAGGGVYSLQPLEQRLVIISFVAPDDEFWYNSEGLLFSVQGEVVGQETLSHSAGYALVVSGFNWQPSMFILLLILIIIVILLILFLVIAKRRLAERVLGKPIPPWKIVKERIQLERLRHEDPRQFYVVRYFLMEQEYQSALDWFHSYKKRGRRQMRHASKATKYEEKAEGLQDYTGESFDARADRWTRWYDWRIRRRNKKRDRQIARLQSKLDKRGEKGFEKDHETWEKKVDKLTKKANKPILRERKKWEKQNAKAIDKWEAETTTLQQDYEKELAKVHKEHEKAVKKDDKDAYKEWKAAVADAESENKVRKAEGRDPVPIPKLESDAVEEPEWPTEPDYPPKPVVGKEPKLTRPDELPPEPTIATPALEDSRYAKKAARKRKKAVKKVAKLEAKRAKRLAKVERKRAKRAAKVEQKRRGYLDDAEGAYTPSLLEKAFRLTPEAHEKRARKKVVRGLHKDEIQHLKEAEDSGLDGLKAEMRRQEAQREAAIIRARARVRKGGAPAGKDVKPAAESDIERMEQELEELKARHADQYAKAAAEAKQRIQDESQRLQAELKGPESTADGGSDTGSEGDDTKN